MRLERLTFDWADVFAEFRIAYPGFDPLSCTIAEFEAYSRRACRNKAWVDGRWTDSDNHSEKVAHDNRVILWKARLPSFFPDPFAEEEE